MNLHHRPLFLFTVAYLMGVVLAAKSSLHPLIGFGAGAGIALVGIIIIRDAGSRALVLLICSVFAIGFLRTAVFLHIPPGDVSNFAEGKQVYVTGTVASDPEPFINKTRLVLETASVRNYTGTYHAPGLTMVTLYQPRFGSMPAYTPFYGDTVKIHGRLSKPSAASNPGAFSYDEYLARKRIHCMLSGGLDEIAVVQSSRTGVRRLAYRFKSSLISKVHRLFPPVHGWLLLGILLGNYAALPPDVQAAFMQSGTMHLLAASGYNCAVLIAIFGFLMLRLTTPRTAMHVLLIALVWGFALIAGPGPSIVRAAIMVTAFLAAYLLWRAPDVLNIILFSCLAIVAVNPLSLFDVGFQLSFAAVFVLALAMPLIEPRVRAWLITSRPLGQGFIGRLRRIAFWTAESIVLAIVISVVAAMGTLPITAYYFNYLSTVSVIANALVAVLVVILTALGIASVAVGAVCMPLGHAVAVPTKFIAESMLSIVTGLGSHPWSSISVASPSPYFILVYYLTLLGVLEYAYRKAAQKQRVAGNTGSRADSGTHLASSARSSA